MRPGRGHRRARTTATTSAGPSSRESVEPKGLSPCTHQPSPSGPHRPLDRQLAGPRRPAHQHDVARRAPRAPKRTTTTSPSCERRRHRRPAHRDPPPTHPASCGGFCGPVPWVRHSSRVGPARTIINTREEPNATAVRILRPRLEATAHCDLPCGVYDPAQARIEAESVKAIQEKYQGNEDPAFRDARLHHQGAARRSGQAPPLGAVDRLLQAAALREVPGAARAVQQGHQEAGGGPGGPRASMDPATGQELLDYIAADRQDLLGDQGRGLTPGIREAAPQVGLPARGAASRCRAGVPLRTPAAG